MQNPASGLGPITALEPLPDGRVLAVESGTRVLVQQADTWRVGYDVASDPRAPTHIAAVAPDSAFDSTHFVYVAEVVDDADGTRTTRVIRTREVASRLGEPSTIVADESLVREGDPALSVGKRRLDLPGDARRSSGSRSNAATGTAAAVCARRIGGWDRGRRFGHPR